MPGLCPEGQRGSALGCGMRQGRMLAIDWGLSAFRAWRLARDGTAEAHIAAPEGIRAVAPGGFPEALERLLSAWPDARSAPMLLCGMVGSRQGWAEAPYADCPARAEDIAARLLAVPGRPGAFIVPGLLCREGGAADVMRGEETQLIGLIPALGPGRHRVCLPGTHSKWAEVEDGAITRFRTAMTGELYALLRAHSTLAPVLPGDSAEDEAAFAAGLSRAAAPGGLLNHLFGVRAAALAGDRAASGLPSFLSGLLIGHEIAGLGAGGGPVHIVGTAALAARYAAALALAGRAAVVHGEAVTAAGLAAIARARGLL